MEKLSVVIEDFLVHCRIGRALSENTLRAYSLDLAKFSAFIGAETLTSSIDRDKLRAYAKNLVDGSNLKVASARRHMACVKSMFRWLELEDRLIASPFHRLEICLRLPRRLPRAVAADELRRLMFVVKNEDRGKAIPTVELAVTLLLTTGLRIGELTSVKLSDIELEEQTIQVRGKGDRERRVYLVGRYAQILFERYLQARERLSPNSETLMVTEHGTSATPQWFRRKLRQAGEAAGISRRLTPHMLRHTAATRLIEAGVDIRFVQKLLGHANISTTQIYTHVSDSSLRDAISKADVMARLPRKRG